MLGSPADGFKLLVGQFHKQVRSRVCAELEAITSSTLTRVANT